MSALYILKHLKIRFINLCSIFELAELQLKENNISHWNSWFSLNSRSFSSWFELFVWLLKRWFLLSFYLVVKHFLSISRFEWFIDQSLIGCCIFHVEWVNFPLHWILHRKFRSIDHKKLKNSFLLEFCSEFKFS